VSAGVKKLGTIAYFEAIRTRPDRAVIREEWINRAIHCPFREDVLTDGRIRQRTQVPEMGGRFLRVVLLPDGETVHNAFFHTATARSPASAAPSSTASFSSRSSPSSSSCGEFSTHTSGAPP
jgi:hypothetical protein